MLKTVLSHFQVESEQTFLKFLPQTDADEITSLQMPEVKLDEIILASTQAFSKMHYSWIAPHLQTINRQALPFFLSILTQKQAKGICRQFKIPLELTPLSKPVRLFFLQSLIEKLIPTDLIPIPFMFPSILTPLLQLNKPQLVKLIQFLGLYDLALEMQKVVDKNIIKQTLDLLNKEERLILNIYQRQSEKEGILSKRKNLLISAISQGPLFKKRLHEKGLLRFAVGLSGEEKALIWYVTRRLDIGRGKYILSLAERPGTLKRVKWLKERINDLCTMLMKQEE